MIQLFNKSTMTQFIAMAGVILAMLFFMSVIMGVRFAWILFDEIPDTIKLIGIATILGASVLTSIWPQMKTE